VECFSSARDVASGLSRFVAIERAGWKPAAAVGVSKDGRHAAFYQELLGRLAPRGCARVHVLVSAGADIAAGLVFAQRDVLYFRHSTYHPEFARFSPGIVLHAEVFRSAFESGHRELDLLSMPEGDGGQQHKHHWASGRRDTVRVKGYRKWGRLMPIVIARSLRHRMRGGRGTTCARAGNPPESS
jgi:CelD/BcsL family acetyltransferase involved in cellulose biosynthesis